jgi:hypothetical protein
LPEPSVVADNAGGKGNTGQKAAVKGNFMQKRITDTVGLRALTKKDWENPVELTRRISGNSNSAGQSGTRTVGAKSAREPKVAGTNTAPAGGKSARTSSSKAAAISEGSSSSGKKKKTRHEDVHDDDEDDDDGVDDVEQDDELEESDGMMYYSREQQEKARGSEKKRTPGKQAVGAKGKKHDRGVKASMTPSKRKAADDDDEDVLDSDPVSDIQVDEGAVSEDSLPEMQFEDGPPNASVKAFAVRWNSLIKGLKAWKDDTMKLMEQLQARADGDPVDKYLNTIAK